MPSRDPAREACKVHFEEVDEDTSQCIIGKFTIMVSKMDSMNPEGDVWRAQLFVSDDLVPSFAYGTTLEDAVENLDTATAGAVGEILRGYRDALFAWGNFVRTRDSLPPREVVQA